MPYDPEVESLVHLWEDGALNRRELIRHVTGRTGTIAAAIAAVEALGVGPERAFAQGCPATVSEGDPNINAQPVEYPGEAGTIFGYLARPRDSGSPARARAHGTAPEPAVLVIHENQGLTSHIKDVTRRVARAGYVGLGVDLISRLGGTPNFPDPVQATNAYNRVGAAAYLQDMLSSLAYLKALPGVQANRLGAVGFCAGGGNCWNLAVTSPDLSAAVMFYGAPPPIEAVQKAPPVLGIYAELDRALTGRMPAVVTELLNRQKPFGFHVYEGANHAFHNDTGPRYKPDAACDAWSKSIAFFDLHLRGKIG